MGRDGHAARVGILYGFVGSDAGVTRQQKFCAIVDDRFKRLDMNAVTFFSAHGHVVNDIRIQRTQCLHQQSRGGLSVHVEVAPDADFVSVADRLVNEVDRLLDIWKLR